MGCSLLPTEMVEVIVDHLHDDRRALETCSLVCRAWTNPARYHLFRDVVLDERNIKQISVAGLTISPFIRHLYLWLLDVEFWNDSFSTLGEFHRIKSFSISYLPWNSLTSTARSSLLTGNVFTDIVRLYLNSVETFKFSELAQIVCAFPHLRTLVIDEAIWSISDTPPSTLNLPRSLRSLDLRISRHRPFLEWILSLRREPLPLHTLYLHGIQPDDFGLFEDLLSVVGASLKALLFGARDGPLAINLRHNVSLQYLHLNFGIRSTNDHNEEWVAQTLSLLSSEHMVSIVFELGSRRQIDSHQWAVVDDLLSNPRFSTLKTVEFRLPYSASVNAESEVIKLLLYLPRCDSRGIVRVQYSEGQRTYL